MSFASLYPQLCMFPLLHDSKVGAVKWKHLAAGEKVNGPDGHLNYGIATGERSGVIVIDTDSAEADAWVVAQGVPETLTVKTGSGRGFHRYFRWPGLRVMNSIGSIYKAVDIKGDGGMVVAPGSPHKSGGEYEITIDVAPAEAPAWLLEWLRARPAPAEIQPHAEDVSDPAELEYRRALYSSYLRTLPPRGEALRGKGDATLFEVVQLGAYDLALPTADVLELVAEHYDPRCSPPWGDELEERVLHKAHDAKTKSTRPRIDVMPLHAARLFGLVPRGDAPGADAAAPDDALPAFPLHVLPPALRDYVCSVAEFVQVPIDLPGMLALGAVSAAISGKLDVQVQPGYVEPTNTFTVIAMPPSDRKSPVFRRIFGPIYTAEERKIKAAAPVIAKATTQRETLEKSLKHSQTERARLKKEHVGQEYAGQGPGGLALDREIGALTEQLSKAEIPASPRLLCDDVTMEKLAMLMSENGGRMCLASAEGTVFGIIAGKYSSNGESSFDPFLKGYSGDPLVVDRVSKDRPAIRVNRPRLVVATTVQPSIVAGLGADKKMRGQGLLARFLFVLPRSLVGMRRIEVDEIPADVERRYEDLIVKLIDMPSPEETAAARGLPASAMPPALRLSTEARHLHRDFQAAIEPRLHPTTGDLAELGEWGGKLAGLVARLAAILHVAEHGTAGDISASTMAKAIELGEYSLAHARKAFGAMSESEASTNAASILAWAKDAKLKRFSYRQIRRGPRFAREANPKDVEAWLLELVALGELKAAEGAFEVL